jgi:Protein of unknown function (DUF992)
MRRSVFAVLGATALVAGAAFYGQTRAQSSGVNVGSLTCNVAGGIGYVFGSSKQMNCLFNRTDGIAERYSGTINKYGVDIGFTKEAQMVWLVFAPGALAPGTLSGGYAGATASATAGVGVGANVLVGGNNRQITLQPVSVEGSVGLNVAAGVGEIALQYVR